MAPARKAGSRSLAGGRKKLNAHQTSSSPEESAALDEIREHLECALRLMDELRPASAFAARCQELIDGLEDISASNK